MRSPDAAFIILLVTLFAFAINDSNGTFIDPGNLWTLLKQATTNGNQLVSSWFQNTFCRPNGQADTSGISSNDVTTELGDITQQDGQI